MGRKLRSKLRESWRLKVFLFLLAALCLPFASPLPVQSQSNTPPAFPTATSTRSLAENSTSSHSLEVPVLARDLDAGDTLTYSLSAGDVEFFSIGGTTGQLEAEVPLDYETRSSYSVEVQATDPGGLYDTVSVKIDVTNVDEAGKVFLSPTVTNHPAELNAFLLDPDGSFLDLSWEWAVSPNRETWTKIEGADSAFYVLRPEEMGQFLRARVSYTDGHGPGKVAEAVFDSSTLSPENNYPPEFPFSESGVRTAGGDALAGEPVGRPVLAADLDGDLLTYVISGDASLLFDIEPQSGQLKTKNSLSDQAAGRYFGVVHVFDGRGGSASITVRIDVGDIPAPAILPAVAISPPGGDADPAPTSASPDFTLADALPGAHVTAPGSGPLGSIGLQSSGQVPNEPSKVASVNESKTALSPATTVSSASAPVSYSQGMLKPAIGAKANTKAGDAAAVAPVAMKPPPPLDSTGGAAASPGGSSGSVGTVETGGSRWFGSFILWAVVLFVGTLLVAGLLSLLLRPRRVKERDITLPPPTIGPERRIAPLPILYSRARDDAGSGAKAD